jgi:hypothetical protein
LGRRFARTLPWCVQKIANLRHSVYRGTARGTWEFRVLATLFACTNDRSASDPCQRVRSGAVFRPVRTACRSGGRTSGRAGRTSQPDTDPSRIAGPAGCSPHRPFLRRVARPVDSRRPIARVVDRARRRGRPLPLIPGELRLEAAQLTVLRPPQQTGPAACRTPSQRGPDGLETRTNRMSEPESDLISAPRNPRGE